jgi:predicted ATPase with chaperone activity
MNDAEVEFSSVIDETLQTRDVEKAYEVARTLADMEDYEQASYFRKLARRWEREDDMPNV